MFGLQLSVVQALLSLHVTGVPAHAPLALQASPVVQRLLSLQAAPGVGAFTHPLEPLHESAVHGLLSLQFGGVPPTQTPPEQVSFVVQALLSLQEFVFGALVQAPPGAMHESLVQTLLSLQVFALPAVHVPVAVQSSENWLFCGVFSPRVHRVPSLQVVFWSRS